MPSGSRKDGRRGVAKGKAGASGVDNQPPAVPAPVRSVVREWWAINDPGEMCDGTNFLRAMMDLQKVCLQYVMKRLLDTKVPAAERDKIALSFLPKLTTELRGQFRKPGESDKPNASVEDLLDSYGVKF